VKALSFDGSLKLVLDAPIPQRAGEALVKVICAGICNTDLEIVKGYAGFHGTLGHEFVGRVVESPDPPLIGQRVVGEINAGCGLCELCLGGDPRHCPDRTVLGIKGRDGAFAEFLCLPVGNLIQVPDSITDEAAVFVEPLAAALNVLEQVRLTNSDDVAIVGDGKLAQLVVIAAASTSCSLTVIGKHKEKLELAERLGANKLLLEAATWGREWERRFDVVIEASGSPSGLEAALRTIKPRGTIVLKSTHQEAAQLDISRVVVNEVTIVGSRCGRFDPAIDLLQQAKLDFSPLISNRFALEEGRRAFDEAARSRSMKVMLQMV